MEGLIYELRDCQLFNTICTQLVLLLSYHHCHAGLWHPSLRVQTQPKPLDFYGRKNPQYAFLQRGSKRICPMSQLCGM